MYITSVPEELLLTDDETSVMIMIYSMIMPIASITSKCNLHCAGCYSRCNHATTDSEPVSQLTSEQWLRIFDEADELGISFILLAGEEPMLRRDIIEAAITMMISPLGISIDLIKHIKKNSLNIKQKGN